MDTFNLTPDQYKATADKVRKVNARAAKKGLAGYITIEGNKVTVTSTDPITGIERVSEMVETTLGGVAPKFDGWTFVATLDWDENAGLVVRTAPGIESVDRSRIAGARWCDHCATIRDRKETYLLRSDEGVYKTVGSTCLKDFLGIQVGIAWLDTQSITEEFEGFLGDNSPRAHGTEYVLALAWALIKLDGYKPSSSYDGSTKGDVLSILYPPFPATQEYREWAGRVRTLAAEAMERAAEVRAFILSDSFQGHSEYVRNLKSIAAGDMVSDRNIGYLVSAPQAWARHLEKTLIRQAQAAQTPSEWVGSIGEKLTVKITVKAVKFQEGDHGVTVIYTLLDEQGNVFTWFSSRGSLGDKVDEEFTIKGTVKKHTEFAGVRQTQLTRCTLVD